MVNLITAPLYKCRSATRLHTHLPPRDLKHSLIREPRVAFSTRGLVRAWDSISKKGKSKKRTVFRASRPCFTCIRFHFMSRGTSLPLLTGFHMTYRLPQY